MTSTTLIAASFYCLWTLALRPSLLDGLTDVDVLHIALGCRFALDIPTVSQHYSSTLELGPLPDGPELFLFLALFPHQCFVLFACQLACMHSVGSVVLIIVCVRLSQLFLAHH